MDKLTEDHASKLIVKMSVEIRVRGTYGQFCAVTCPFYCEDSIGAKVKQHLYVCLFFKEPLEYNASMTLLEEDISGVKFPRPRVRCRLCVNKFGKLDPKKKEINNGQSNNM